jgi:hypothetical protein
MTIRNWNTTIKLLGLMDARDNSAGDPPQLLRGLGVLSAYGSTVDHPAPPSRGPRSPTTGWTVGKHIEFCDACHRAFARYGLDGPSGIKASLKRSAIAARSAPLAATVPQPLVKPTRYAASSRVALRKGSSQRSDGLAARASLADAVGAGGNRKSQRTSWPIAPTRCLPCSSAGSRRSSVS